MTRTRRQRDRALVYATFNGVFNNTNGIGRQTKTMLSVVLRHHREWRHEFGPFDFHLVAPLPVPTMWGYSSADLDYARAVTARAGGGVHFCPAPSRPQDFWSRSTWEALSSSCAAAVCDLTERYRQILLLAVDTPYLGVAHALRDVGSVLGVDLEVLLVPYSTSLIVDRLAPNPDRLAWEQAAIRFVNRSEAVHVGDIGRFMTAHLVAAYGLDESRLVPFPSSLDVEHDEFRPMSVAHARRQVDAFGVPRDRPVVLAFGRADRLKGFHLLIQSLAELREEVHLVLIAVPYTPDDEILGEYQRLLDATGVRATRIWRYERDLPKALCQIPETRVVACPSLGEALSNVPFEVALWAHRRGPVLVCPAADGFVEQVADGVTGFTYDRTAGAPGVTDAVRRALDADQATRTKLREAAHRDVLAKRNAAANVADLLRRYWHSATAPDSRMRTAPMDRAANEGSSSPR